MTEPEGSARKIHLKNAKPLEICPFMSANQLVWDSTYNGCIKEKCAIWSEKTQSCSLRNGLSKKQVKREPSEYNKFASPLLKEGKSFSEVASLWRKHKLEEASD